MSSCVKLIVGAVFLIHLPDAALAEATSKAMSGKELKLTFAGRTIYISAPFGSLPVRYSISGSMVAQSTAMQAYSGHRKDTGTWRISGNRICQRWKIWMKGKEQCFTVTKLGSTLHWTSNDGMTGTASTGQ